MVFCELLPIPAKSANINGLLNTPVALSKSKVYKLPDWPVLSAIWLFLGLTLILFMAPPISYGPGATVITVSMIVQLKSVSV